MYLLDFFEPQTLAGVWAVAIMSIPADNIAIIEVEETKSEIGVDAGRISNNKHYLLKTRHKGLSFREKEDYPITVVLYSIDDARIEELKSMGGKAAEQSDILQDALGLAELSVASSEK